MNNVHYLHRVVPIPSDHMGEPYETCSQEYVEDTEATDWSLLFFVGLCGFVGGFVVACLSLIVGAYFAGALS